MNLHDAVIYSYITKLKSYKNTWFNFGSLLMLKMIDLTFTLRSELQF